jgi:hypothetical protein
MLKKILIFGAAMLFLETPAIAQQRAVVKACVRDINSHCQGVGQRRIRDCIKLHFSELSGTCQVIVMKGAVINKTCHADVKKNCAGVKVGGGRIEACMKEHASDISEACNDVLVEAAASGLLPKAHRIVGW